jgi:hypothetical protein
MTDHPKRIQLSRQKGWRMPAGAVKVDRSTKWGNPWRVGEPGIPDAAEAVRLFRDALFGVPRAEPGSHFLAIQSGIAELRGKNLACWCPLDQPCHADVLLQVANRDMPQPS